MSKEELVLAALSTLDAHQYAPVQIQKLLFLIDRRMGREIGGPYFNFIPYHYGPFDKEIYALLDRLARKGLLEAKEVAGLKWKLYQPTPAGRARGQEALARIQEKPRSYMIDLARYVVKLSFDDLVSSIYKAYPDMEANSIFKVE